ncbi:MAG: hypothetical protein HONDAALG_02092 [Gammaproteobacteria bacterium]|nr:hypothetical protein [Gammaproteobacteria bacterium]
MFRSAGPCRRHRAVRWPGRDRMRYRDSGRRRSGVRNLAVILVVRWSKLFLDPGNDLAAPVACPLRILQPALRRIEVDHVVRPPRQQLAADLEALPLPLAPFFVIHAVAAPVADPPAPVGIRGPGCLRRRRSNDSINRWRLADGSRHRHRRRAGCRVGRAMVARVSELRPDLPRKQCDQQPGADGDQNRRLNHVGPSRRDHRRRHATRRNVGPGSRRIASEAKAVCDHDGAQHRRQIDQRPPPPSQQTDTGHQRGERSQHHDEKPDRIRRGTAVAARCHHEEGKKADRQQQ